MQIPLRKYTASIDYNSSDNYYIARSSSKDLHILFFIQVNG